MLVGITELVVQMRTAGSASVAAISQDVTHLHRDLALLQKQVLRKRLARHLLVFDVFADLVVEAIQMCVNRHISIIMSDIHHIAVAVRRHPDATHITVSDRINTITCLAVSLDIHSSMKSVVAQLAKRRRKINRYLDRIRIFRIRRFVLSA